MARGLTTHGLDDDVGQRHTGQPVEEVERLCTETVGPDDVDEVPGRQRAELLPQEHLAFFVNRKWIEDRVGENDLARSGYDVILRGAIEQRLGRSRNAA